MKRWQDINPRLTRVWGENLTPTPAPVRYERTRFQHIPRPVTVTVIPAATELVWGLFSEEKWAQMCAQNNPLTR
jgi:hypothetical protein